MRRGKTQQRYDIYYQKFVKGNLQQRTESIGKILPHFSPKPLCFSLFRPLYFSFSFSLLQSLVYLDTILPSINSSGDISDKYLPYHLSFFAKDSVTGHKRKHHIFGSGKQVLGDGHYFNWQINIMINTNNFRTVNGPLNLFSHTKYLIN